MLGPLDARLQALRLQLDLLQNQLIDRIRPVRYNQLATSRAYLIHLYEDLDAIEHGYEASLSGFYSELPIGHRILFALAQRADIREREHTGQATWQEMAQRFTLDSLIPRWREIARREHGVRNDGFATEGHMPPFQTVEQEAAHVGRPEDTYEGLELEEIRDLEFGGIMPNGQRLWVENLQRNTTMQLRNSYEIWRMNQPEPYFDPVFGHPFDVPPPQYEAQPQNEAQPPYEAQPQYEAQPPNYAQPPNHAQPPMQAQPLYEPQPPMPQAQNLNPFVGAQDPFYGNLWPQNDMPYLDDDSQDDRSGHSGTESSGYDDTETETESAISGSNSFQFYTRTPTPPAARSNNPPAARLSNSPAPRLSDLPARRPSTQLAPRLNTRLAPRLNSLSALRLNSQPAPRLDQPPPPLNRQTLLNNGQPIQNISNVRTQFSPPSPLTPLSSEGSGVFLKEESPATFEEDARGLASLIPSRCGSEDTARFTDSDACSDTSTEIDVDTSTEVDVDTDLDMDAEYDSECDSEYYPSSEGTVRF
ncbi:hypothetical protein K525DRAFT_205270 [Schizophyllum commune Loenen D]|nr:hypothetical protein K525DRAFT_205270 [Schizophyllum commune Loenen D]